MKLGDRVRDALTGFMGVATGRAEYLYGCVQVQVTPRVLKEGKPVEPQWFDEQRLNVLSTATAGGPQSAPTRRDPPRR